MLRQITWGGGATALMLLLFAGLNRVLSGSWQQVIWQFNEIGIFLLTLAIGFGVQVALWRSLKDRHRHHSSGQVTVISGSTSTIGMLACCTHYLVNIIPFLGLTGVVSFTTNYQVEILVASISINLLGISYLLYLRHRWQCSVETTSLSK